MWNLNASLIVRWLQLAYINVGGYNVITVDWSSIAKDINYAVPAELTLSVGSKIAEFLDRLIDHTKTNASDIHLIGHSLGAHVMGSCGLHLKSGKIGRITGEYCIAYDCGPHEIYHVCIRIFMKLYHNRMTLNSRKKRKPNVLKSCITRAV